ncbi:MULTISPECIES: ABC transporter permease [unclassified Microbacterium]|uniref:ABC transporter permease n=1 Tax=unclassified Microbacterium TaxID=2609290 RepID=UPI000EAA28C7|nr:MULTISPECIES: ABC transporter permease [unclassified Microbacterium]MBT2483776.1 ABC transporter permease [Microbacterium sp. ISL-108]RKN66763.1 ABC transporter permease [Microbacterium sp. CGR2]
MNASTPAPLRSSNGIWLVAEREIGSKLRSKTFLISTGVLLLLTLAGIVIGGFASKNTDAMPVAATSQTAGVVSALPNTEVIEVSDKAEAEDLIRSEEVEAAVLPGDGATGFTIVALKDAPTGLVSALSQAPAIEILEPATTNPGLRYLIALAFGVVFMGAAATFGGTIAQSVVEEKQTRVVEVLLSAIPARTLLAGKVIGNTILVMGQILALAAIATIGLIVTGQREVLSTLGAPIIWFAVFFLFGFILLAALFAAAASLVSRQEDIGATTTPITMLIMAPYVLVILFNDNPLVLTIMSYVPFSAPVGMPMRLFVGEAQWWEPLLSLVILLASCVAAIVIGAKIYENSLLRMGSRVKLREALRA